MTTDRGITMSVKKFVVVSVLAAAMLVFAMAPSVGATDYNTGGNPGNHKPVGNAGESPNGRDFGGGAKGRSDAWR